MSHALNVGVADFTLTASLASPAGTCRRPGRWVFTTLAAAVLSGCASVNFDQSLSSTNQEAESFTQGKLNLARTDAERDARQQASARLLSAPLGQKEAVELALVNSPALQALLAQSMAQANGAAQGGRIANPIFTFERLRTGDELELGRMLSFGLLDLLTLPQRYGMAQRRMAQTQLNLTGDVVDRVTAVRQAWVRAVAAQQTVGYARQVLVSAEASADLARRMQAVGNFNKLDRVRQQAFYADAATQLASTQHQAVATREELVRQLGLSDQQATQLQLPARLPDLPQTPLPPETVAHNGSRNRLDVRLAQSALASSAQAQGLNLVTSFTDIELGIIRNTTTDPAEGTRVVSRGTEISVRLPVFDWGGAQRDAMNAQTLAAAHGLEATVRAAGSHLRESYSAYRTTYDVARHHRDEVLPLRKAISEENLLRYNGMLIGVFELLSDSRDQVGTVMAAIAAEQQFWLADAALQSSMIGRPTSVAVSAVGAATSAGDGGGH